MVSFEYGYDGDSQTLYQQNDVVPGSSELFEPNPTSNPPAGRDPQGRPTAFLMGQLSPSPTGAAPGQIASPAVQQTWAVNTTGNYQRNAPASDAASNRQMLQGNLTANQVETALKEQDTAAITVQFDPWNNLTNSKSWAVTTQSDTVVVTTATEQSASSFTYDALGRRITDNGTDLYYDTAGHVLQEGPAASPSVQYVWGAGGQLAVRDRAAGGAAPGGIGRAGSPLNERLYPLTDASGDVTSVAGIGGSVLERYAYTPEGKQTYAPLLGQAQSTYNFRYGFKGWRMDGANTGLWEMGRGGSEWDYTTGMALRPDPVAYANKILAYHSDYVDSGQAAFDKLVIAGGAIAIGTVVTIATAGAATPLIGAWAAGVLGGTVGGAAGGAFGMGGSAYASGGDAEQVRHAALVGGAAGAVGGAVGALAGGAAFMIPGVCPANLSGWVVSGVVGGVGGGAAGGGVQGYATTHTLAGTLEGAGTGALFGGIGGAIGGAAGFGLMRGAGFKMPTGVCFTAGTPVLNQHRREKIESFAPGRRVLTEQTKHEGGRRDPTAVDPASWRLVRLEMANPDGSADVLDIRLLRPLSWLAEKRCEAGGTIPLSLPEMGLEGPARVVSVGPCPQIEPGRGRVVTATFTHLNGHVLRVKLAGLDESIEATETHPFFSEDHSDWVRAKDLRPGERLRTADGVATVEGVRPEPGVHRVYNLEVEGEHHYFVSRLDALVHNWCETTTAEGATSIGDAEVFEATGGDVSSRTFQFRNVRIPSSSPAPDTSRGGLQDLLGEMPLWDVGDNAHGALIVGGRAYRLTSGGPGGEAGYVQNLTPPEALGTNGFTVRSYKHVEGSMSALLNKLAYDGVDVSDAVGVINLTPCRYVDGCDVNLPSMLPPGGRLRLLATDGTNGTNILNFDKTYVGRW